MSELKTEPTHESTASSAPDAKQAVSSHRKQKAVENWQEFASNRGGLIGLGLLVLVIVIALLTPILVPLDTLDVTRVAADPNQPPGDGHLLGTDPSGRDVLGMLLWGSRISLLVGFLATLVSMVIGTTVGMMAGHFTGFGRAVLLRVVDFFLVIPQLVLAITLSAVMSRGILTIIIAIGVTGWASTARMVRSQTLSVEARPYIERARALGAGDWHIITKHVLPAVMPIVLANTTLHVGSAVIAESTLAFLGVGDPNAISWGSMLKRALDTGAASAGYWWYILPPGIAIAAVVMCFTLVGRALESVVNPSLRGR